MLNHCLKHAHCKFLETVTFPNGEDDLTHLIQTPSREMDGRVILLRVLLKLLFPDSTSPAVSHPGLATIIPDKDNNIALDHYFIFLMIMTIDAD